MKEGSGEREEALVTERHLRSVKVSNFKSAESVCSSVPTVNKGLNWMMQAHILMRRNGAVTGYLMRRNGAVTRYLMCRNGAVTGTSMRRNGAVTGASMRRNGAVTGPLMRRNTSYTCPQ